MLTSKKVLLTLAAAGMIFSMTSCKKTTPTQENNIQPVVDEFAQFAEKIAKPSNNWNKEDVNALLAYVPEDTAFILASSRQIDVNHPFVQNVLGKYTQSFAAMDELFKELNNREDLQEDKETLEKTKKMIDSVKGIITDYKANAPQFGLNPEHMDAVTYLSGNKFVYKQTVDDGAKLKTKAVDFINMMNSLPDADNFIKIKETKSGNETWQFLTFSDDVSDTSNALIDSLKKQRDEAAKNNDTAAVERYNKSIADLENDIGSASMDSIGFAIHYGQYIVTAVLITKEKDLDTLDEVLKPAAKPLNKSALGTIDASVAALGYIDNTKALNLLMAPDTRKEIEKLLSTQLEPACDKELGDIVADYPRISLVQRVDGNNKATFESVIAYKDKEVLNKLRALHAPSLALSSDKTQLNIKFNLDLAKLIDQSIDFASALSQKTYECSMIQEFSTAAKEVPALANDLQFTMYKSMISRISGLNIAIDKLDLKQDQPFEGLINLTGPSISDILANKLLLAPVFAQIPGLSNVTPGGEPTEIDLNHLTSLPLKLNAVATQTDLLVGTSSYDIKTISAAERKPNQNFFELTMTTELYHALLTSIDDDASDEKLKQSLKDIFNAMFTSYTISVGTNDEGLVETSVVVF